MVLKVFRFSGKFAGCLESLQVVWKVSSLSGKFPLSPKSFLVVLKVSRLSGKFSGCLGSFQVVWKVFRLSEKW